RAGVDSARTAYTPVVFPSIQNCLSAVHSMEVVYLAPGWRHADLAPQESCRGRLQVLETNSVTPLGYRHTHGTKRATHRLGTPSAWIIFLRYQANTTNRRGCTGTGTFGAARLRVASILVAYAP